MSCCLLFFSVIMAREKTAEKKEVMLVVLVPLAALAGTPVISITFSLTQIA